MFPFNQLGDCCYLDLATDVAMMPCPKSGEVCVVGWSLGPTYEDLYFKCQKGGRRSCYVRTALRNHCLIGPCSKRVASMGNARINEADLKANLQ